MGNAQGVDVSKTKVAAVTTTTDAAKDAEVRDGLCQTSLLEIGHAMGLYGGKKIPSAFLKSLEASRPCHSLELSDLYYEFRLDVGWRDMTTVTGTSPKYLPFSMAPRRIDKHMNAYEVRFREAIFNSMDSQTKQVFFAMRLFGMAASHFRSQ